MFLWVLLATMLTSVESQYRLLEFKASKSSLSFRISLAVSQAPDQLSPANSSNENEKPERDFAISLDLRPLGHW